MESIKVPVDSLPEDKRKIVSEMVQALSQIKGIEAIALGGSYARGVATKDSDIDLVLYYFEKTAPSLEEIGKLAKKFDPTKSIVAQFYEWGPWVNGGAWINANGAQIDWVYRNLDQINWILEEAQKGHFFWDYRQQPPYGYFSTTYLADLEDNIALHDPKNILASLNEKVDVYPEPLRESQVREHLWSIEFTFFNAEKLARGGSIYGAVGCLTRMATELTQVLFALNRHYFIRDKDALEMVETFKLKPKEYKKRLEEILSCPGKSDTLLASLKKFHDIFQEVVQLASAIYVPKFPMDAKKSL